MLLSVTLLFVYKKTHLYMYSYSNKSDKITFGIEAMHMVKKKQIYQEVRPVKNQVNFIHQLFGIRI